KWERGAMGRENPRIRSHPSPQRQQGPTHRFAIRSTVGTFQGSVRFLNENGTLSTLFLSDTSDSSPASPPPGGGRNVKERMIDSVVPVRVIPIPVGSPTSWNSTPFTSRSSGLNSLNVVPLITMPPGGRCFDRAPRIVTAPC